jgi:hypothetical protein
MSVKVEIKTSSEELVLDEYLTKLCNDIKSSGSHPDPKSLLPIGIQKERTHIYLKDAHSAFANCIRRMLIEELPVKCLDFDLKTVSVNNTYTDDEFILVDVLQKNINLLPLNQAIEIDDFMSASIAKRNNTPQIIPILSQDITFKMKKKYTNIVPNNILIGYLRPGKYLELNEITIAMGYSKYNAGKFSLLDNVSYKILDQKPYDVYTKTGQRSIEYDPKEFQISFLTTGNITARRVLELLRSEITHRLNKMKKNLLLFIKEKKQQYDSNELQVVTYGEIVNFIFKGEYITLPAMVAQRCYILDKNVAYCSSTIKNYENKDEQGIIRIKHPEAVNLIISAIDSCIKDIEKIK